jgi:hypothetical protein
VSELVRDDVFVPTTSTVGVDLSAQPSRTACCVIEWGATGARIAELDVGYDNEALVELIRSRSPGKVAIDSPFGWPVEFSRTIAEFTATGRWPDSDDRRPLLFRATDLLVSELTGADPLSVSSNLLAICAMRCARVLTLLGDGNPIDRAGGEVAAEVYPAAALRQWSLDARGYKGSKPDKLEKRAALVRALAAATASWLALDELLLDRLRASDHLVDALICAIVGRAVQIGVTLPIPEGLRQLAAAEGWIHLPQKRSLAEFDPA